MTWTTVKGYITAKMTGYTQIANKKDIEEAPESQLHKGYSLYMTEVTDFQLSSSQVIGNVLVRLEVSYKFVDSTQYDSNIQLIFDLADNLVTANQITIKSLDTKIIGSSKLQATFILVLGVRQ